MPKRAPLPRSLALSPFSFAEAIDSGVTRSRLRGDDLDRPFYGVRAQGIDLDVLENRCLAFSARMRDGFLFSHDTAARLWGIPLPVDSVLEPLHVTAVSPVRAPRVDGTIGHTRAQAPSTALLRGLIVASPAETWADLSERLEVHDLVAAGEYVVTGNPIRKRPPLSSMSDLQYVTDRRAGSPGSRARTHALRLLEVGALSRPESLTRLLLVGAGLPHPCINRAIADDQGRHVATPDLSWPEFSVALEYEGDGHRAVKRFRDDIARVERLVDHGWAVVKATADDPYDRPDELIGRAVRRLQARGWSPGRIRLPKSAIYKR